MADVRYLDVTTVHDEGAESKTRVASSAAIASLTGSTGGTANGALEDTSTVVGAGATDTAAALKADVDARLASIANNFQEIVAKQESILSALRTHGLISS